MTQADSVHSTPPIIASVIDPQKPALYLPVDAAPEQIFRAVGRLKKEAQDEVDRLLTFLDALEDPDLEEGGDAEPDLGSVGICNPDDQTRWASGSCQDLEREHDGAEPDVCDEPSLGSADAILDQREAWRQAPAWVIDGEVDEDDDPAVRKARRQAAGSLSHAH